MEGSPGGTAGSAPLAPAALACSWQSPWLLLGLLALGLVVAGMAFRSFYRRDSSGFDDQPGPRGFRTPSWARLWPLLVAAAPVLVGATLVGLLGPINDPLSPEETTAFQAAIAQRAFLGGTLTLVAVLVVHVCVCALGVFFAVAMIRRNDPRGRTAWLAAVAGAALAAPIFLWPMRAWPIFDMSYFYFERLYAGATTRALLEPRLCLLADPSYSMTALALAVVVPITLGVVGAALMAAAMNDELHAVDSVLSTRAAESTPAPDPAKPWPVTEPEVTLQIANGRLKRCLYLLSLGLVTSTVAVSLFFHLPGKLARADRSQAPSAAGLTFAGLSVPLAECVPPDPKPAPKTKPAPEPKPAARRGRPAAAAPAPPAPSADAVRKANLECLDSAKKLRELETGELAAVDSKLDSFASELSIFWAAVFALTLLAAAGVPAIRLQRRVRKFLEAVDPPRRSAVTQRLTEGGILNGSGDQAKFLIAILAPLITGPIANILQAVAGS